MQNRTSIYSYSKNSIIYTTHVKYNNSNGEKTVSIIKLILIGTNIFLNLLFIAAIVALIYFYAIREPQFGKNCALKNCTGLIYCPNKTCRCPLETHWDKYSSNNTDSQILTGHSSMVCSLAVLPNGDLVSASNDTTIKIWDVNTRSVKTTLNIKDFLAQKFNYINVVTLRNGDIASGYSDGLIRIWDVKNRKVKKEWMLDGSFVYPLTVLSNGDLVTKGEDRTITIWNVNDGKVKKTLTSEDYGCYSFTELPNGNLASVDLNGTIKIWNVSNESIEKKWKLNELDANKLAALTNGDLAISFFNNTKIEIRDIYGLIKRIMNYTSHDELTVPLVVLPNGDLARGDINGTITIWDVNNGSVKLTLVGHNSSIASLAVLQNGDLASGYTDGIIRIWNLCN